MEGNNANADRAAGKGPGLTQRERQVMGLLAEGRSGARIADELVLSPDTVRTHIRNAMSKLGATTRSHAVALALRRGEIEPADTGAPAARGSGAGQSSAETSRALERMLGGLETLHDIDGGGVYLSEDAGLSLRRVAATEAFGLELPEIVALGDGTLGRAALERRSQLYLHGLGPSRATLIAVPIMGHGLLLGVLGVGMRVSRPVSRHELLLLQTFANCVGDVLAGGGDVTRPLAQAMVSFRASWAATSRSL